MAALWITCSARRPVHYAAEPLVFGTQLRNGVSGGSILPGQPSAQLIHREWLQSSRLTATGGFSPLGSPAPRTLD